MLLELGTRVMCIAPPDTSAAPDAAAATSRSARTSGPVRTVGSERPSDRAARSASRQMPKTRAGRGTALKNSILAQAWFLVENQTPADIEQMMESWRKEAWSFYGNHTSRTNCSTNISHTTLIQDYTQRGAKEPLMWKISVKPYTQQN